MLRLRLGPAFLCVICLAGILSGCGGGSSDSVSSPAAWSVTMSNIPTQFGPSGVGEYSISVTNTGLGASIGSVTVTDTLPAGLTASGMSGSGTGWTCTVRSASCTTLGAIAAGASATITLTVNVAQNASGSVTNLATVSGGGAASNGSGQDVTQIGTSPGSKINHVLVIFQENRTPDNLFQGLCAANGGVPGCGTGTAKYDLQGFGFTSSGTKVTLVSTPLATTYDLGHSHAAFLSTCQWNASQSQCAMNGSDLEPCSGTGCPAQNAAYEYVQTSDVQPYLTMAETYTFGDMMFQTNEGPSFPAHQYILSGTSAISETSTVYVSDNPINDMRGDNTAGAGCLAPPGASENSLDTSLPFPNQTYGTLTSSQMCLEHPTLTDLLESNGLTWKYYSATDGSIWTAPDAIQHMCQPSGPADQLVCSGPDWTDANPNVVLEGSGTQITTDIGNGQLASVTWVIPTGQNSDHAGNVPSDGPSWVTSIVNAIGQSAFWSDTTIIVAWDDWGGWYDHVPPPIRSGNSYEYGFRVPLLVISPYAKPAYVSHAPEDFGSILRFIEINFGNLGFIGPGNYADSYALGDLSDCFNFGQTPLVFTPIQAPLDANHFRNDKSPPAPPDDD